MSKIFLAYAVLLPYILFINIFSFGSNSLGMGTVFIIFSMLFLFFTSTLFMGKIKISGILFLGLSSFFFISLLKLFFYNIGQVDMSFLQGGIGNWLFFIINFILASLYLKNSPKNKQFLIKLLSYSFILSSIIGIFHYYFLYSVPFMDPSYGTDEVGTVFNVADYDLMRFRESSIFFGANVNAYMTVLGYVFLVFSLTHKGISSMLKKPIYWVGLTLHCWNIFISDSRSGILLIAIITLIIFYDKNINVGFKIPRAVRYLIVGVFIVGIILYVKNQPRLNLEALIQDERLIKIAVGAIILTSSIQNFFIGAPVHDKWTIGEVSVSDNMYIAVLLYVGIVGLVILIVTYIAIFRKLNRLIKRRIDYYYNLLVKYFVILFLFIGLFSIPIGMMPFMIYFGIFLGGVKFSFK